MSEPSSSVPDEIADAQVEETQTGSDQVEKVELDLDEDKLEAWDEVKGVYQIDPDAPDDSVGDAESDDGSDDGDHTDETDPSPDES